MRVLIALFTLCFSSLVLAVNPVKNIVVFGDSLSDNGNLYEYMKHHIPISPPYFSGRFTNGPVWVELLAASFFPDDPKAHLIDYAFGGAAVAENSEDEDALFTLQHEVDVYLLAHNNKADPESLFTVWMGANNYLAIPEDMENAVNKVTTGISKSMERLVNHGAKNILVLNLPDLGKTPVAREFDTENELSLFVYEHNKALKRVVAILVKKYPHVKWIYYDVNYDVKQIMDYPEVNGFKNVVDTCYDEVIEKPSPYLVLEIARKAKTLRSDACEGFLYFDPVHPTAPAHQMIAERVHDLLAASELKFVNVPTKK